MAAKRAFVISPIGAEGSSVREHADDVFDFIIKPAMEECGIEPVRSDHLKEPGTISAQMFREILADDLSIAVLTGYNPNVFYELAIAQAAGRPVIILIEKGLPLPFDIQDLRCVQYDFKPRPLLHKVYAREIVHFVRELEKSGWQVKPPFGGLSPLGAKPEESLAERFTPCLEDAGQSRSWFGLLQGTKNVFELMGQTQGYWAKVKGFGDLVAKKASEGCKMRVLLMHRENPSLAEVLNSALPGGSVQKLLLAMDEMYGFYRELADRSANVEVRRLLRGSMHCTLTRTDDCVVYSPRLFSEPTRQQPTWQCDRTSVLYDRLAQEFEVLWQWNDPLSPSVACVDTGGRRRVARRPSASSRK
jgi:hypothetical protein